MLRRIVALISVGLISGVYADQGKLDQIQKSLESIMAKAGISIGGEFRSQYLGATMSGDSLDKSKRLNETNEFTSVDFDIKARPNEYISGRIIFRMHQNWQNFYSDISNPIFSRWISIDGNPLDMFRFNIGDFKEKYSPLTLYSPDIEILYEPYIFARQREVAMDELFIGDNYRILQGINFGFDAEVEPLFNEFHLGLIGVRLRSAETNIQNGSKVADIYEKVDNNYPMTKYMVGSNLDLTFLKGINLGGTYLFTFDHRGSLDPVYGNDTVARWNQEKNHIISARPGIDIGKIISSESFGLGLKAEFAFSVDDSTMFDSVGVDTAGKTVKGFIDTVTNGMALNAGLDVSYSAGDIFGVRAEFSYMSNDRDFRNALAQSPSFIGHRIMNNEVTRVRDSGGVKKTIQYYSTFDALYNTVFKFTTKDNVLWTKSPYMKTSYYRGIMDKQELNVFAEDYFDPTVQLVLPMGPASPNRSGINGNVKVAFLNNGIEFSGLMALLKEKEASNKDVPGYEKTEFTQFAGGFKIDFNKFIPAFKYPAEISLSYVSSAAANNGIENFEITSNLVNFGINYQFWKRAAVLFGLQLVQNEAILLGDKTTQKLNHWSTGFEWKVSDGASVVTTIGQIIADNDDKEWLYGIGSGRDDFKQMLLDVFLRVKF
jgi:hypothetical protein